MQRQHRTPKLTGMEGGGKRDNCARALSSGGPQNVCNICVNKVKGKGVGPQISLDRPDPNHTAGTLDKYEK